MRKPTTPHWHLDLVRLRRERPDMTHAELAATLGKSVTAVRHVILKPKIKEMIAAKTETSELETKAKAMNARIQTNLEMTENLLGNLRNMMTRTMEETEAVGNAILVDWLQDETVDEDKKITVIMKMRDQGLELRKLYALPAPAPKGGNSTFILGGDVLEEITASVKKIASGNRRTTEGE